MGEVYTQDDSQSPKHGECCATSCNVQGAASQQWKFLHPLTSAALECAKQLTEF